MEHQVSRRIPVLKSSVKKHRASHVSKGVDMSPTSKIESGKCQTSVSVGIVVNDSKHSTCSSSISSTAENISETPITTTMDKDRTSEHKDIVKKPRLHKDIKDSLLAGATEARHSQHIASFGVERSLGCKTPPAKVTYVGSGLMPLSSPLLSNVGQTTLLSYALYAPLIGSAQSQNGSQLIGPLSPVHIASRLPAALGSATVQMLTAADTDVCSVTDSKVVENAVLLGNTQSPSESRLIGMSSPLCTGSFLPAAAGSADVQTLTVADVGVRSVDSSVIDTKMVEYTPMIGSTRSASGPWSMGASSSLHTAGRLPTAAGATAIQTVTAADADVCSVDSSVIDTEVVETVLEQHSLDDSCNYRRQKQTSQGI